MTKDKVQSISPAKFFSQNRGIAGFDNPSRALYTTLRELVENALDACEAIRVFPDIRIRVRKLTRKELKDLGIISHQDEQKNIDKNSNQTKNNKEKESETKQEGPDVLEIIVSDNGKGMPDEKIPVLLGKVLTSTKYKVKQHRGRFGLGLKMAIIYALQELNTPVEVWSATRSQKFISYYSLKIDIVNNEPIVRKHKKISKNRYKDPWNRNLHHGTVIRLITLGDWTRANPYVLEYLKQLAIITPYASFLFEGPSNEKIFYERVSDYIPPPPKESRYHLSGIDAQTLIELMKENKRSTMLEFLRKTFDRIGPKTAKKFLSELGIDPETKVREILKNDKLITSFVRKAAVFKFTRPDASCLSPIGKDLLKRGLKAILKPEFVCTYQRKPISLQGHPLIVEVALAYGGEISPGLKLYRFANRVPLLHRTKSDVAWKALEDINLSRYKLSEQDPIVLAVSIVSTKIPFPVTSKDFVDNVDILRNEIKLAFMKILRKLRMYLSKKEKLKQIAERRKVLLKYVRRFAYSVSKVLLSDPKFADVFEAREDILYAHLIDNIDKNIIRSAELISNPGSNEKTPSDEHTPKSAE
ncbi:MAG: DNA topoisomerase VI subunit B [Candidatus Njordarchaeota archaeon]